MKIGSAVKDQDTLNNTLPDALQNMVRALLFPSVTAKARFLLHKTIEEYFPELTSFSVGEESHRRTVVTWPQFVSEKQKHKKKLTEKEREKKFHVNVDSEQNLQTSKSSKKISPFCEQTCKKWNKPNDYVKNLEGALADVTSNNSILTQHCESLEANPSNFYGNYTISQLEHWKAQKYLNQKANSKHEFDSELGEVISSGQSSHSNCIIDCQTYNKGSNTFETENYESFYPNLKLSKDVCALQNNDIKCKNITINKLSEFTDSEIFTNPQAYSFSDLCTRSTGNESKFEEIRGKKYEHRSKNLDECDFNCKEMSVSTMVAEPSPGFNRRRVREGTQVYRPPPARGSRSTGNNGFYQDQLNEQQYHQQQQYLEALKQYNNFQDKYSHQSHSHQIPINVKESDNKQKSRRPDQLFYVPKARRVPDDRNSFTPCDDISRPPSPTNSVCSVVSEFSGRNRYNKSGKQSKYSFDNESNLRLKPPMPFSKESSSEKGKNKSSLFASETLQLIERCINQDSNNKIINSPQSWDLSSHQLKDYEITNDCNSKNSQYSKVNHPIHSKENMMHPLETRQRSHRGKRNRKRCPKSREQSTESGESYSRRSSVSSESLDRSFYNSNSSLVDRDNFSTGKVSCSKSFRPRSRNASAERLREIDNDWRPKSHSHPSSPNKYVTSDNSPRRHSLDKYPVNKSNVKNETNSRKINSPTTEQDNILENEIIPHEQKSQENIETSNTVCSSNIVDSNEVGMQKDPSLSDNSFINKSLNTESNKVTSVSESISNSTLDTCSTDVVALSFVCEPVSKPEQISTCTSPTAGGSELSQVESDVILNASTTSDYVEELNQSESSMNLNVNTTCEDSGELNECESSAILNVDSDSKENTENSVMQSRNESPYLELGENDVENSESNVNEKLNASPVLKNNPKKFSFNWADEVDQNNEEDSWDSLYDDSGNCLHNSVREDLEDNLLKIKLERPTNDYLDFKPQETCVGDDFGHIIEIYDFPATFQTQDLLTVFQEYKGFDLKWVDDTHALGIFNTQLLAADCLSLDHPFVKTRPLSKGIEASKLKAIRLSERLPYKPRPETSVALARRLVTGALGLRVKVTKEQRDAERQKLKDAKEKKKLIAKQKEDAWEGNIGNAATS